MRKYLTFLINGLKVGIPLTKDYTLEETLINKSFSDDEGEYIIYKGSRVPVYDTGEILDNQPLKKFDGLVFVYMKDKNIAFKTEGFFKVTDNVKKEVLPLEV
jgi:hypothetical protein